MKYLNNRNEFPQLIDSHNLTGVGVEVGTAAGDFARILLQSSLKEIILVDDFSNPDPNYRPSAYQLQSEDERITIWEMTSQDSVNRFDDNSLDFVYIDAQHEYKYVSKDLNEWWKKLKIGGIIAGHDYTTWNWQAKCECGVVLAVEELAMRENVKVNITGCESTLYLDRLRTAHLSKIIPSFWMVKK